jgi:hypothetical protein
MTRDLNMQRPERAQEGERIVVCFVGDTVVPPSSLTRREMNFGQPVAGIAPISYRIEVDAGQFADLIREPYARLVRELIEDDPNDDGSFAEINRLRNEGWPELEKLLKDDPTLLFDVVREWLAFDLLDAALRADPVEATKATYAINSVLRIRTSDGRVCLTGEALRYPN